MLTLAMWRICGLGSGGVGSQGLSVMAKIRGFSSSKEVFNRVLLKSFSYSKSFPLLVLCWLGIELYVLIE